MEPEQPTLSPFTSYQKFVIAMLALLQFTVVLDFMVLSPLGDILMKSLDLTPSRFGLVVSSYAFSAGISGILAAGFADKFDRKKLLLFFYSGFIIGTVCCATANSYHMLLAARIVTGLFGGVIGAVSMAILTDLFQVHQRGRVLGFVQMSFAASQVLGIPIGLYIANAWGWHAAFLMIVGLGLLIGLLVFFKMQPVNKHLAVQSDKNAFVHLWHTFSNNRYQTGFLATAFLSIGGFMLMPFGSAFLINNVQITQDQLPIIFMITGLSSIVIMPLVGKLSDKIDKFRIFAFGSVLAIIMVIVYTRIGVAPIWQVILINIILFAGIMSRMIPATTLTTSIPEMKDRGAFMSINSSLQQMAGGIAAICAGMIVTQPTKHSPLLHYNILGYVVSVAILICAFLVFRVYRLVHQKEQ